MLNIQYVPYALIKAGQLESLRARERVSVTVAEREREKARAISYCQYAPHCVLSERKREQNLKPESLVDNKKIKTNLETVIFIV